MIASTVVNATTAPRDGTQSIQRTDPDYEALTVANRTLGGPFGPNIVPAGGGRTSALSFMVNGMLDFGDDDGVSGFVGAGLMFAGITDTCAMGMLIAKLPYNRPSSSDVPGTVRALTTGAAPAAARAARAADVSCAA